MLHDSAWIRFLRQYGPVPTNDNMYDEHIQKAARNKNMTPISFDAEYLEEIKENFRSENPVSIILTGTAGDGKTYYCRQIWEEFNTSTSSWKEQKIHTLPLKNRELVIIKDLSELSSEDAQNVLPQFSESIISINTEQRIYLIAANDGQLMEKWRELQPTEVTLSARQAIEDLLVNEEKEKKGFALWLYNLSRIPVRLVFPRILNAVLHHEGWQTCADCPFYQLNNAVKQCPIWENKERLEQDSVLRSRLLQLLELCELNNIHLPVRQLLLLISNMLLGHPNVKEYLMTCKDVVSILDKDETALGSIYRNTFGENLGRSRRQLPDAFKALNRFGIGNETNSHIDNMLIFGKDDPSQQIYYERFVLNDSYYGADNAYQSQQTAYLEGTASNNGQEFLSMLRAQRQRLFFTITHDAEEEMNLWSLTVFQYAGEYLKVIEQLRKEKKIISKTTLAPLVRGLNRIFTGLLVREADQLILATSGSYSQARVCHILEERIPITKKEGKQVFVQEDDNGHPFLVVSLGKSEHMKVSLKLQLTRFEFLYRVAEGALPSSFSRECYEDILSFKTNLLRQLDYRKKIDGDDDVEDEDELELKMIYLDGEGDMKESSLEVRFS